jgi:hypothetical protein
MQDRLNSMNPLTFGDTIRLPALIGNANPDPYRNDY